MLFVSGVVRLLMGIIPSIRWIHRISFAPQEMSRNQRSGAFMVEG